MILNIEFRQQPIDVLGNLDVLDLHPLLSDFVVKIDGNIAPDTMRDIILMGMLYQARYTDCTFAEVIGQYLGERGI